MDLIKPFIGKILYGILFVVVIPGLLVLWAWAISRVILLPELPFAWAGWLVACAGLLLMLSGWIALAKYGHGLPMNAYPPQHYVARGIYRFVPHPIYLGFVMLCFGLSIAWRSPGGIWIVTPMVALASAALVLGYEKHDLRRRFGTVFTPLVALPPDSPQPPTAWHRASIFFLVFLPWMVAYEMVVYLGVPRGAIIAYFAFEETWPVLEWTELVYGSVYLFVITVPLFARTQRVLRRFALMGLTATVVVTFIYLTIPVIAPPRPFEVQGIFGQVLLFERSMSGELAAFPSFHVLWSLIAAEAWAARSPGWKVFGWSWALLISISCLTTGMHALLDLVAAVFIYIVLRNTHRVELIMSASAEHIANSWREWRWRGLRVINYGFYAVLAGTVGFWIAAALGGKEVFWQLVFIHIFALLGAGLWAQKLEGSPRLARPFGYYGSAIGAISGSLIAGAVGGHTFLLLTLVAMEAPWVQAIGRFRCLVQGCCHGRKASEKVGIRYWQPQSRVVAFDDLKGVPLYPTPLYSILANLVIGVLLLRLWHVGAPLGLIAGGYFMLASVARFVEESYRGEPQTPVILGLPIYQWLALLSFVCGAVVITLPAGVAPVGALSIDSTIIVTGILYGIVVGCAMGVDFPDSAKRFARLAPPR